MIYLNLKSDSSGGAQTGGAAGLGPSHGGAQGLATNAHRHGPADRAGAIDARARRRAAALLQIPAAAHAAAQAPQGLRAREQPRHQAHAR